MRSSTRPGIIGRQLPLSSLICSAVNYVLFAVDGGYCFPNPRLSCCSPRIRIGHEMPLLIPAVPSAAIYSTLLTEIGLPSL